MIRLVSCLMLFMLITPGCFMLRHQKDRFTPLQQMVQAEKQFAEHSRTTNTREAFLSAFAADGLIFYDKPVNAIEHWSAQPTEADWLDWKPIHAAIAASGEIGYTTGPYTYKPERTDSAIASHGYFFSVWLKEKSEWKVWLDLGISAPLDPSDSLTDFRPAAPPRSDSVRAISADSAEALFIAEHTALGTRAWRYLLSENCRVTRPGALPAKNRLDGLELIRSRNETTIYRQLGSKTAASGEFAVTFGSAEITQTSGDSTQSSGGHYIRVWRLFGDQWKIEVDLHSARSK